MPEIGAVYDATPAPRTAADILPSAAPGYEPAPGPVAVNKWLCASVVTAPAAVIKRVFDEAERRDPKHRRTRIALVDGANHQIDRITFEARKRELKVTIVVGFVHVLQYLWNAANCLHPTTTKPPSAGCTTRRSECSKDSPARPPARSAAKQQPAASIAPPAGPPTKPPTT
jgi:hypothetical protein